MTKRVAFGEEPSAQHKTFPNGVLLKPRPLKADSQLSQITSVYNGGTKINRSNLAPIYSELAKVLKSATFASINDDSLESQDVAYPTCLEVYTVLHSVLRQGECPMTINEILGYAKRDLSEYRKSSDVLALRVLIQILKCVDILFYTDTNQNASPSLARFFVEQALAGVSLSTASKAMLCICLHIFNHIHMPKLLDAQLSLRLLQAMQSRISASDARKSTSALSGEYLTTFKTLFKYQKPLMLEKTQLWVPILMNTLVDHSSFIRQQGLSFLQELAKLDSHQISTEIFAVLNSSLGENPFASVAVARMIEFQTTAGEAKATSTTWSTLLMIMNSNPNINIETWPLLARWLEVPRMGFSSDSLSIKSATYSAWEKVIYLFAFRYEHNTSVSRNLSSIIHPIKPKRQTSLAIFDRFKICFNSLLFIALRCCDQTPKHLSLTFSVLVKPCVEAMLEHPLEPLRNFAVQTLSSLLSMSPGSTKAQRSRVVEEKPLSLVEIGGFPRSWIRENVQAFTELLLLVYREIGFDQVLKYWDSLVAIIRQGESANPGNFHQQLLVCTEFLSTTTDFAEEERSKLFTTFVCSFNYSVLVAEKFQLDASSGKIQVGNGVVSCATMLLSQAVRQADSLFDKMLARFSTFPSRQVALVAKTCMSNPGDTELWDRCIKHISRLVPTINALDAQDAGEILRLLELSTGELPDYWVKFFTLCYNKTNDPEFFFEFVERQVNGSRLELFYDFKRTVLIDETLFDSTLIEACVKHKPELLDNTEGTHSSFKTTLARYFYRVGKISKGVALLDARLKANADLILETVCTRGYEKKGRELWALVCDVEGSFTPAVIEQARQLHEQGLISLPEEIEPLSPLKRSGQLSPPPTSPMSTPKKQRLDWTLTPEEESIDFMSSPPKGHPLLSALDPEVLQHTFNQLPRSHLVEIRNRLQQAADMASTALGQS